MTQATNTRTDMPDAVPVKTRQRSDEILAELYAIKAVFNREANYDVATLLAQAKLVATSAR